MTILRQEALRRIVLIILISKKVKCKFLIETLKIPVSTLSFYLNRLAENNIVEKTKIGHENVYTLKDESMITKVLIAYQSSFLDKLLDNWAATWLESRFIDEKQDEGPL